MLHRHPLAPFVCALALAFASPTARVRAQEPTPVAVPEGVRCGLGKAFHAGRRAELRRRIGEGVLVFRGLPETRDYTAFRQDKNFWYLTGVESPGAVLVMDAASGREILFLPEPAPRREGWEGELWDSGDAWVGELTGFEDVRPESSLLAVLGEMLQPKAVVYTALTPWIGMSAAIDRAAPFDRAQAEDPLDGRASREEALRAALEKRFQVQVKDCASVIADMRLVKTPEEIGAMRRAADAGALAMNEAMRSTRPDLGEWELDALMSWLFRRNGADGPAYHAIVGSGPNSCTLHYSASSRVMRDGEILLIDYAPEYDHYTCDITRTWPVNGHFSERQAELYDAVLAAQAAGIAAVHPGGTIRDVEKACREVLAQRGFTDLIRHGSCHLIGMEVHDVGDASKPLVPGVAFTVEPGLYERETGIGIRIEDVVIVTADGCEVVSRKTPKARGEVEALVAQRGVLELVEGDRRSADEHE